MVSATARLPAGRCVKNHCRWDHPRVNATAPGDNESARLSPIAGIRRDIFVREIGLAGAASVFPLSVRGSVRLKLASAPTENSIRAAVTRIADMLRADKFTDIRIGTSTIEFHAGVRRWITSWRILLPFGRGTIHVEPRDGLLRVSYDLSMHQLLIAVTLATATLLALLLFCVLLYGRRVGEISSILPLFAAFWVGLIGINYVAAMFDMPRWLRKGLRELPELQNS